VERCDFRNAELRNALFHSITIDQVQLPGWPHIVLLSPYAAGKSGPEPHIFVSPSAKRDSVESAMRYISYCLERIDHLGHPRIRY
jgi:hypothetical protein